MERVMRFDEHGRYKNANGVLTLQSRVRGTLLVFCFAYQEVAFAGNC